jgi:NAD(P)-dependent dehydrogenase (short-subunit alcohol dehydrogenase family)
MSNKAAVVTGAATGLGSEIAAGLAAKGYRVFGTASSTKEIAEFERTKKNANIVLTVCDITKDKDVSDWHGQVASSLGTQGLDLLVNNMGVLTRGPMEIIPLEAARKEFEVSTFGGLSTIKLFLPLLRKTKGRIVQIGSYTGRFSIPFGRPSSTSKATMEAFADVYRTELRPLGVDFTIVDPGIYAGLGSTREVVWWTASERR